MNSNQGQADYRVLILSASAGTGHIKAAEALEQACLQREMITEVAHVDALDYTNKLFRDFYSKLYTKLVQDAPTFLVGGMRTVTNRGRPTG
ncbi:MAG: hypothetical protein HC904_16125, partial [Blastochloris sp.]|nr:hypothetical protein [Blastochloris sp.]